MTEEVMEQVRGKMAQFLFTLMTGDKGGLKYKGEPYVSWYGNFADQILSIPEILIKDPDQSLPNFITWDFEDRKKLGQIYKAVVKEHWVKVLPKEEK